MHQLKAEKLASSKTLLAKLLAAENVDVIHNPAVKTAYFDLQTRTVVCPVWKDMEGYLYDFLLSHEVGHALYTKLDDWKNALKNGPKNFQGFVNVIEDVRIEKFMKNKFPGLKRSYIQGNKWLIENGFFGDKAKSEVEINKMGLIDRINLYFRVDDNVNIHFAQDELKFVRRAERLSTWDDVVSLAKDIYDFQKQKESETEKNDLQNQDASGESGDETGDGSDSSQGDSGDESGDDTGDGSGDTHGDSDDEENQSGGDGDGDGEDEGDNQAGEGEEESDKDGKNGDQQSDGRNGKPSGGEPKSETDEEYRSNQGSLLSNYSEKIQNLVVPDVDSSIYTINFRDIMSNMTEYPKKCMNEYSVKNRIEKVLKDNKDAINYLVKEFEMKKAADQHKRTKTSKTGVIDPTSLHSYRFNEDIFKRSSTVTEGKNHGLIMYVDWSSSMKDVLPYVIDQIMILVKFCQKVNIPFAVYGFATALYQSSHVSNHNKKKQKYNDNTLMMNDFRLIEFVSSDLKNKEIREAFKFMQLLKEKNGNFGGISLGMTPLGPAAASMGALYRSFKQKYNVDVLNTIFLTDGGGNHINKMNGEDIKRSKTNYPLYLTDEYTKKTGAYTNGSFEMAVIDLQKKIYNMNVMNFHIASYARSVKSPMERDFNVYGVNESELEETGYTTGKPTVGFDEVYVIFPKSIQKTGNDDDVEFRMKNRKKMRLIMSKLAEKIS